MKRPSHQYYPGDWLKDPQVRMCSPATRGLWWDWLSSMMVQNVGSITGTREQLARIAGVTPDEASEAILELHRTGAASVTFVGQVTEKSAEVTLLSRRLSRDCSERVSARERKRLQRSSNNGHADCHGEVTEMSRLPSSSSSSSSSSGDTPSLRSGESPSEGARLSVTVPSRLVGKESAPPTKREAANDHKHQRRSAAEDESLRLSWLELWGSTPAEHQVDERKAKVSFLAASARHPHREIVAAWRQHVAIWSAEGMPARFCKLLWKWLDEDSWSNNLTAVRAKASQRDSTPEKATTRGTFHAPGTLKPAGQVVRPVLPAKESA